MQCLNSILMAAASICFTLVMFIAGCGSTDAGEESGIPGHYELSKYLARGPFDGLYDAMTEDSARVEMTLTEDLQVEAGRWFNPNRPSFENCPPEDEREIRFQGDYTVRGDTIMITLDEGCYDTPGRAWLYRSDTLFNLTLRDRAFYEVMELVKVE